MTGEKEGGEMVNRRGAPKGNKNAFTHGFYARDFTNIESEDLEAVLREGLQDEIAMLRVSLRRLFRLAKQCEDVDAATKALLSLSRASGQLANLLKTQKLLTGKNNNMDEAISTAISQVVMELVK